MRGERKLDVIIDTMENKWDRMDRYWFQKNRHLDQKMRKKKDMPTYNQRGPRNWGDAMDTNQNSMQGVPHGTTHADSSMALNTHLTTPRGTEGIMQRYDDRE